MREETVSFRLATLSLQTDPYSRSYGSLKLRWRESESVRVCQQVCRSGVHIWLAPSKMIQPLAKLSDRFPKNIGKFFDTCLFEPRTSPNERGGCQLSFGYTLAKKGSRLKKLWVFEVEMARI